MNQQLSGTGVDREANLIVLVYVSAATRDLDTAHLATMLAGARRRNALRGVTGLLAYGDGMFMQAIEGPASVVDRLFAAISADPRHSTISVLLRQPLPTRQFPDHSMAFREMTSECLPEGYSGLMNDGARAESFRDHPDRIHRLLQHFADTQLRRYPRS